MTESTPDPIRRHGPVRQAATRAATVLFVVALLAMLLLGAVIVFAQLGGLVVRDAEFIVAVEAAVGPATYAVAAAFGIITLGLALLQGTKSDG